MPVDRHFTSAFGWATSLALLLLASPARSEQAVRAVYASHLGCPGVDAFKRGVSSRTDKAKWVDSGEQHRFEVRLVQRPDGGTDGTLSIVDPGAAGAPSERTIPGADCATVVDALALVAALAIDPAAKLIPEQPPPEPPPPKPILPPPPPPKPMLPPPVDRGAWRWLVGAHVGAASGFGDVLSGVVPLFVDVGRYHAGWLAPSFRLGFAFMPDRSVARSEGQASFTRFTGQLSGCPVMLGNDVIALRPCAGVEAGVVRATRDDLANDSASNSAWLSFDIGGRLQWFPVDWLLLEAAGAAGVPAVRLRYHLEPDLTLLELSPVYGAFSGGAGIRFE